MCLLGTEPCRNDPHTQLGWLVLTFAQRETVQTICHQCCCHTCVKPCTDFVKTFYDRSSVILLVQTETVKFTRQYVIIDHQPIVCATPHAFGVYDNNAIFNTLLILPPYIHSSRLFQEEKNATLRLQCTPLKKSELKEVTLIWAWCVLPLGTPGTCVITARVGYHPAQHTWS